MSMATFLHSGDLGDIIYFLPTMRHLGGGIIYLCTRPYTKEMTPARFEAIRALLLQQPYVTAVEMHKGQKVKYDVTEFRKQYRRGSNLGTVQARYINAGMTVDFNSPWLITDTIAHGRPVIARSPRYHAPDWDRIWPMILEDFPKPIFIGLPEEHSAFEKQFGKIQFHYTGNLLMAARLIAGSPMFIGNQSSPFAVCEGLKHNSILETHPTIRDVIFRRPNGKHVTTLGQYRAIQKNPETFGLCLQFYPGDVDQACELTSLIADLETDRRKDVEFILAPRFDVLPEDINRVEAPLVAKFPNIKVYRSTRRTKGWPAGCNDLFHETLGRICAERRKETIHCSGVFMFEPDCLPLRADWIDCLREEWNRTLAAGKHVAGHATDHHINGNLIISTRINSVDTRLVTASPTKKPWDAHHGKFLLSIGSDAPSIYQTERIHAFTDRMFAEAWKAGERPAIWHGIKDAAGVAIAREFLIDRPCYEGDNRPIGAELI